MKCFASLAAAAVIGFVLASCSGAVSGMRPSPSESHAGADLVATAPSVRDDSPGIGAPFTLSVTVRNVGGLPSPATTVRYYRSEDAVITASDVEVGSGAVPELTASGSTSLSVVLAAASYYYGACVNAVSDEADTINNCSTAVQVTAHDSSALPQPDLLVTSVSVSDDAPAAGAGFTLSATVRNAGGAAAGVTTLRYYRSADATITTSDTAVGTTEVAELAASGSDGQSVELTAPAAPGTYHYGACVDAVADESDPTNNCSASVPVRVADEQRPDLQVTALAVSDGRPVPGAAFTLSATVGNGGNGAAGATTVRYFRSEDAMITTSDTRVGSDEVAELAASGSASKSVELTAPAAPGTYHYGACVDAVPGETDTTDNCSPSIRVSVQTTTVPPVRGAPDLAVTSISVSDADPDAGAQITLSVTVSNGGNGASDATTVRYFRSEDATITTSDTQVATDAITGLGASGSAGKSVELAAPATPGTYPLRSVRGRGGGRDGQHQQLFGSGAGHGTGAETPGPGGDGAVGERWQSGRWGAVYAFRDGQECGRWGRR